MDNYYRRLRDMREDHDLSQRQLATLLHIPQSQYHRYESGQREIPIHHLIRLAIIYKTSIDYLVGLTDNPTPYEKYL